MRKTREKRKKIAKNSAEIKCCSRSPMVVGAYKYRAINYTIISTFFFFFSFSFVVVAAIQCKWCFISFLYRDKYAEVNLKFTLNTQSKHRMAYSPMCHLKCAVWEPIQKRNEKKRKILQTFFITFNFSHVFYHSETEKIKIKTKS